MADLTLSKVYDRLPRYPSILELATCLKQPQRRIRKALGGLRRRGLVRYSYKSRTYARPCQSCWNAAREPAAFLCWRCAA